MDSFRPYLAKVATGAPLSREEARNCFDALLVRRGDIGAGRRLSDGVTCPGETVDELAGAVSALRSRMVHVSAPANAIDIVGTGGDKHRLL